MCGRFTQQRSDAELAELFDAEPLVDDPGRHFNVAPTDDAAVVVEARGQRVIARYRWGLVPHWAPDPSGAARMINARLETIGRSPAFRDALARHRCLVPVDGFYEWHRTGGRRQPYLLASHDGSPLALAGLWAGWHDPETDAVRRTFTIVTTAADPFVASIHDRMPVILPPTAWTTWLDPALADPGEAAAIINGRVPSTLTAIPVGPLVNNVRNDGPALVVPLDPDELGLAPDLGLV